MERSMQPKAPLLPRPIGWCRFIIVVSFAVRASFGVFQIPIADGFGWLRSEFSLHRNSKPCLGVATDFGAIAERVGDHKANFGRVDVCGGTCPILLCCFARAHQMYEILVGFGVAGTGLASSWRCWPRKQQ